MHLVRAVLVGLLMTVLQTLQAQDIIVLTPGDTSHRNFNKAANDSSYARELYRISNMQRTGGWILFGGAVIMGVVAANTGAKYHDDYLTPKYFERGVAWAVTGIFATAATVLMIKSGKNKREAATLGVSSANGVTGLTLFVRLSQ